MGRGGRPPAGAPLLLLLLLAGAGVLCVLGIELPQGHGGGLHGDRGLPLEQQQRRGRRGLLQADPAATAGTGLQADEQQQAQQADPQAWQPVQVVAGEGAELQQPRTEQRSLEQQQQEQEPAGGWQPVQIAQGEDPRQQQQQVQQQQAGGWQPVQVVQEAQQAAPQAQAQQAGAQASAAQQQQQQQHPLPVRPPAELLQSHQAAGLLTFENDPVPPVVKIEDWQHTDAPQELTSSTFLTENGTAPDYLAFCLVIRDQQEDVVEWVMHHLRLGASKIYVFDNGSDPPLSKVLGSFIADGRVEYEFFTTFTHPSDRPQLYAYDKCLQEYGPRHHWLGFIDVDEFLIFRDGPPVQSLPDMLKEYEQYSGLGVHWILFGSSGHVARPQRGVLRSYYKCLPLQHSQHTLIKTIANTRCTTAAWGPHAFHHNCSLPVVRTNRERIDGPRAERPVFDRLVLHHYTTKSLTEFQVKMKRGSGMRRQRGMEYFWFVDAWSVEYNFDAVRIWDDDTNTLHLNRSLFASSTVEGRYESLPVHAWNA